MVHGRVIRCARSLPRQPAKPDASGWPEVISSVRTRCDVLLSLSTSSLPPRPDPLHHSSACLLSSSPLIVPRNISKVGVGVGARAVEEPVSQREGGKRSKGVVCGPRLNAGGRATWGG